MVLTQFHRAGRDAENRGKKSICVKNQNHLLFAFSVNSASRASRRGAGVREKQRPGSTVSRPSEMVLTQFHPDEIFPRLREFHRAGGTGRGCYWAEFIGQ